VAAAKELACQVDPAATTNVIDVARQATGLVSAGAKSPSRRRNKPTRRAPVY
jgi:hypothetical protein